MKIMKIFSTCSKYFSEICIRIFQIFLRSKVTALQSGSILPVFACFLPFLPILNWKLVETPNLSFFCLYPEPCKMTIWNISNYIYFWNFELHWVQIFSPSFFHQKLQPFKVGPFCLFLPIFVLLWKAVTFDGSEIWKIWIQIWSQRS